MKKNIIYIVLPILSALVLILLYIIYPDRDIIPFITVTLGGVGAIYSASFVGLSIIKKVNQDRISSCLKYSEKTSNFNSIERQLYIANKLDPINIKPNQITEIIESEPKLNAIIISILNLYEEISVAIQFDYINEKIMYTLIRGMTLSHYNNLKTYIEEYRKKHNKNSLWEEYEKLATAWEKGTYLKTKKKIKINLN